MTEPATFATVTVPRRIDPLAFAPGLLMNGATIALFLIALLRGSERTNELGTIGMVAIGWTGLLLIWLFRFFSALAEETLARRDLLRWALAPLLFTVAAIVVFSGAAMGGRMALSSGALDAAADAALAGRSVGTGWIGLYPVESVSVDGQSVRFDVADQNAIVRDARPDEVSSGISHEPAFGRWSIEYVGSFLGD